MLPVRRNGEKGETMSNDTIHNGWEHLGNIVEWQDYDDAEEAILEECNGYVEIAETMAALLSYFGDLEHDERAVGLVADMLREYLDREV